jgi:hypothetical protein
MWFEADAANGCDPQRCHACAIHELAPDMGHASHLVSFVVSEQPVESGISICVNRAFVACEKSDGMLALAVDGEPIPGAGRRRTGPRLLTAHIGPDPCRFGLLVARRLHLHGCIVGEQYIPTPDNPSDLIGQRFKKCCRPANPIRQSRPVQIDAFSRIEVVLGFRPVFSQLKMDQSFI